MEASEIRSISFPIETEVASADLGDLLIFLYQQYIVPLHRNFANVRRWIAEGREVLACTFVDPAGFSSVDVEIAMGRPIEVKMTPIGQVPRAVLNRLREDLIIAVQMFEEKVRRTTLYFAWVPKKGAVLEKMPDKRRKVISRIFFGNMLMFFVIFLILTYAAFILSTEVFGIQPEYFPIILVAGQFLMVLFSHKIVRRMGDWDITAQSPYVHILQYHIPAEEFGTFQQRYTGDVLLRIKKEIHDRSLALGSPIDGQVAQEVFSQYGFNLRPENLLVRTVNVYQIVKDAAKQFRMAVPKIALSNVIVPNAAATGPSPRFGLVLVTTGLLVQLDEDEVRAVVGHEMSHVRSRDPLSLFALVSAEYLLRIYLFWPYIYFFGFLYFFLALGAIYFIAKFFEARADLESAIKLGHPETLAGALRKIGYRRIQLERMPQGRIGSWLGGFNPHPPVSFRVERLENLRDPQRIKHPFIQSIKDCINGLLAEI